jgi:hypothetical protein
MPIFAENCADQMTINFALNTFDVTKARQPSKFAFSDAFEETKARHR